MIRAQNAVLRHNLFYVILSVMLIFSIPAFAQHSAKKLNNQNIENFIAALTEMASGNNLEGGTQNATSFFEKHLHPGARFKSSVEYVIPGSRSQSKNMALDKAQFIENVAAGPQAVENYENRVNVKSVKVSSDGRRATIETRGIESGMMTMPDEAGNMITIPMEGHSDCQQIIMLSDNDIMQVYNANCKTVINFSDG
jgi:hypothetical protein